MASTSTIIGMFSLLLSFIFCQDLGINPIPDHSGICPSVYCNAIVCLGKLDNCVTIVGNLRLLLMEQTKSSAFQNVSFPKLREVTGFVVIYRVLGLESLGMLFPNLTRIRGQQLMNNYGLVIHDMPNLREVGLYSLLKIDRGGVIVWGGPHTCYVNTIDWNTIAPKSRHMLSYPEMTAHCNSSKPCQCSTNEKHNKCWNSNTCQRYLSGPKAESCHEECLGCRESQDKCSVCRHFTYKGRCVPHCPPDTIVLPDNMYCITTEECKDINGWVWNNSCVFECPVDHMRTEHGEEITCDKCLNCQKTCSSLTIHSLSGIQQADRCVYIVGSLTIHIRSVPGAIEEMKKYLRMIEEVTDYVIIYGSISFTSLDFLSSLRHIGGRVLKDNAYSLIIHDMKNLRTLFPRTVMRQLQIDRGKLKMYNNPKICMSKVNELKLKFPVKSNGTDIPPGMNGYSGGCDDSVGLKVQVLNETAASVTFSPYKDPNVQYTVLYARVSPETHLRADLTPETCSDSEWFAIHTTQGAVLLTSLRPASIYTVCLETYSYSQDPLQSYLARTTIVNFTTPFQKPEPPFIEELVAFSPNTVSLRWVDHKDYRRHITGYQLDVTLIEIPSKDLRARDHCSNYFYDQRVDYSRHTILLRAPREYACGPTCESLLNATEDLIEDHFDFCSSLTDCNYYEEARPNNSSFKNYVRTLALDINKPNSIIQVKGLAPFRDYRVRLRACAGKKCSRSTRNVIRTLKSNKADIPSITFYSIDKAGYISIEWKPPDETNGPLFAYYIQILPYVDDGLNGTVPDIWCVYPEQQSLTVKMDVGVNFQVKVCSSTLGSISTCSDWKVIESSPEIEYNILLTSIFFCIILAAISAAIGFFYYRRRRYDSDVIPLVDITSMYRNESDSPNVVMLTDFLPIYSIPLTEPLY